MLCLGAFPLCTGFFLLCHRHCGFLVEAILPGLASDINFIGRKAMLFFINNTIITNIAGEDMKSGNRLVYKFQDWSEVN